MAREVSLYNLRRSTRLFPKTDILCENPLFSSGMANICLIDVKELLVTIKEFSFEIQTLPGGEVVANM